MFQGFGIMVPPGMSVPVPGSTKRRKETKTSQASPNTRDEEGSIGARHPDQPQTVTTVGSKPVSVTEYSFALSYAGEHTVKLEAISRSVKRHPSPSELARPVPLLRLGHGLQALDSKELQARHDALTKRVSRDMFCIVCLRLGVEFAKVEHRCQRQFCIDCVETEEKWVYPIKRSGPPRPVKRQRMLEGCPLCWKRCWDVLDPEQGIYSPWWNNKPLPSKHEITKLRYEVWNALLFREPSRSAWVERLDDGSINSDHGLVSLFLEKPIVLHELGVDGIASLGLQSPADGHVVSEGLASANASDLLTKGSNGWRPDCKQGTETLLEPDWAVQVVAAQHALQRLLNTTPVDAVGQELSTSSDSELEDDSLEQEDAEDVSHPNAANVVPQESPEQPLCEVDRFATNEAAINATGTKKSATRKIDKKVSARKIVSLKFPKMQTLIGATSTSSEALSAFGANISSGSDAASRTEPPASSAASQVPQESQTDTTTNKDLLIQKLKADAKMTAEALRESRKRIAAFEQGEEVKQMLIHELNSEADNHAKAIQENEEVVAQLQNATEANDAQIQTLNTDVLQKEKSLREQEKQIKRLQGLLASEEKYRRGAQLEVEVHAKLLQDKEVQITKLEEGAETTKTRIHELVQRMEREAAQTADLMISAQGKDKRISDLEAFVQKQTEEIAESKENCVQNHNRDVAQLGIALCQARGIGRGNREGVRSRLAGDNDDFPTQLVERLLENSHFERKFLDAPRGRKRDAEGRFVYLATGIKIENEEDGV